jgi:alkylhydroperoxidase family enzyme
MDAMNETASRLRKTVVERVLHGAGEATGDARRSAFENREVPEAARALIDKVTKNAWKVSDEDVAAAKQAGMSDDQIFELAVAAALGQSTRQLDSALAALDEATKGAK